MNKNINRASSSSLITINSNLLHIKITLKTELQAIAVSATLPRTPTFCSIYIPCCKTE